MPAGAESHHLDQAEELAKSVVRAWKEFAGEMDHAVNVFALAPLGTERRRLSAERLSVVTRTGLERFIEQLGAAAQRHLIDPDLEQIPHEAAGDER